MVFPSSQDNDANTVPIFSRIFSGQMQGEQCRSGCLIAIFVHTLLLYAVLMRLSGSEGGNRPSAVDR